MTQRRTVPRRVFEGGGSDLVDSSPKKKDRRLFKNRMWLCQPSASAALTMLILGSVNGWTTISLAYLISGTGGVPLTLTHSESSWIVSCTVLGSMIGSLVAIQLASSSGSKNCLVLCNTMFTLGWFTIYAATSVPMLYLARGILGIGVGIARTVNPMYVPGVTDINIGSTLSSLCVVNVSIGTLVTSILGLWLMYESLLQILAIISFISFLSNTYFPETLFCSVATGQTKQACKSISYYQSLINRHKLRMELHALRTQTTYELHRSSSSEIHQPSTSQTYQSSLSEIHQPSTSEISPEHTCEIRQPSTSQIHRPTISEIHQPPTSQTHQSSSSEIHQSSTDQMHRSSSSEINPDPTCEIHQLSTSQTHQSSSSEIHQSSTDQMHRSSSSEINPDPTYEILPDPTCEILSRFRSDLCTQSNEDLREWADTDETHIDLTKYNWSTKLQAVLQRSNRKALFIMLGLIMAQHLSGNYITMQYLLVLFGKTTINIRASAVTILVMTVGLICGTLCTLTVTSLERRTLLILSTLGSCFTLIILATYLLLVQYKSDVSILSPLPVIDLIIYQVMFHIGLGTLPNVLQCELFPTELKGFVGAIIAIFDGIIGFTVSKLYQMITDNVGSYAIYFIFATSCWVAFMIVFIWVPETKGKTYREIEALLVGENLNSLNEEVRTDEMDIRRI